MYFYGEQVALPLSAHTQHFLTDYNVKVGQHLFPSFLLTLWTIELKDGVILSIYYDLGERINDFYTKT